MKKALRTFASAILSFFLVAVTLQAQGPDAFGYTWKKSSDPGGPTFNWVDITAVGSEVTGLGDDNSVAFVQMGMDFRFYWSNYNKIKIGSNGWLSFDNVSNIASCFPVIPTVGGPNNLICPLMSDLNFDNNSPGKIYTYHDPTPGDEKFIISYENVTFWTQTNPIFGSNTFQVILSKADSSITFQYATMEPDFTYTCTGSGKVAAGIENLTGNIGLQVYSGTVPPSNHAVKFYYPQVITLAIDDIGPTANNNEDNEGIFLFPGSTATFNTTISNTGNTSISSGIDVFALVRSFPNGDIVYSDDLTIPTLANGAEQTVSFTNATIDWPSGTYSFEVSADNIDDINPTNDLNATEINVLDTIGGITKFGYVTGANAGPTPIQWAGGGNGASGGGIEIESPVYPLTIAGVEAGISPTSVDGFTLKILDDDGPNGSPGTVLTSLSVPAGAYVGGAWNQYLFNDPVVITSGSFYLGWFMDGNTVGLLVEIEGPISNRAYEILSGSWAKYRTRADIMLRAIAETPVYVSATKDIVENSKLEIFPNPSNGMFNIDNKLGNEQVENPKILNALGEVVFEEKQAIPVGQVFNLNTDLPSGIYYLHLNTVDGKRIIRKLVVDSK